MKLSKEEIIALFPLKAKVTQEIIDSSDINSLFNCIGANTLKSVFKGNNSIYWVVWTGIIKVGEEEVHVITSKRVNMVDITTPQEVTFIVVE